MADTQEYFEVSWDDSGNRRHQLASQLDDAQEVARGFIQDHNLNGVEINKFTVTVEPVDVVLPEPESVEVEDK